MRDTRMKPKMPDLYPWDFESINRRAYLIWHGIDVNSGYIDCLVVRPKDPPLYQIVTYRVRQPFGGISCVGFL